MGNLVVEDAVRRVRARQVTRRAALQGAAGLAAVIGLGQCQARAEEATPAPSGPVTIAAHRLTNPRGFAWDGDGVLHVALAGSGGAGLLGPDEGGGYATTGISGIVARIEQGRPVTVSDDLPSTTVSGKRTLGPASVAFVGDELFVLEDANAMAFRRDSNRPDGVYRVAPDGTLDLIADTAVWSAANPAAFQPADYNAEGELMGMVTIGDALWVVESNIGQVLRISLDGAIERVADLSENHPIPTSPAVSPTGSVYVGFLTPAPYGDGTSRVVEVMPDGTVTEVWTGLTMVTAVATAPDGTLYAAEMATGNTSKPPYVAPETGRIVRRTADGGLEEVATHVNYPVALAFGPDSALYVAAPSLGSLDPDGYILRIDMAAPGPHDVRAVAALAGGRDFSALHTDYFGDVAPPAEAPAMAEAATVTATSEAAAAGGETIRIDGGNFYFEPNAVEIPAAAPVTFEIVNITQIPHNFSIDALGVSVDLAPEETGKVTITAPAGTYEFYCNLPGHKAAGMVGTLTVR